MAKEWSILINKKLKNQGSHLCFWGVWWEEKAFHEAVAGETQSDEFKRRECKKTGKDREKSGNIVDYPPFMGLSLNHALQVLYSRLNPGAGGPVSDIPPL